MSGPRLLRYNPALLSDDELAAGFVVRESDLALLVECVRENTAASANQHVLVVGPRGMGKTMLLRRLALEVQRDPQLAPSWYPLAFGEEAYEVGSTAELWLQALFHLGEQTGDPRWRAAYDELRAESDERRLRDRALALLMDFADARGRRILLLLENLHMLLDEQLSADEAWTLRKTLQTEPRLMLVASATSRFGAIDDPPQAMYGFFRPHVLAPLDMEACRRVWQAVAGVDLEPARARPIQILTGGNTRLLAIVAAFAGRRSFRELMTDLVVLVDEHTTFFKASLEGLPAQERRVFVALADAWAPATAREVADLARVDVNAASALLGRLVARGAVEVASQEGRRKRYQVTERLFNVYYLLRRHGRSASRVQATVEFMAHFYEPSELPRLIGDVTAEALRLEDRRDHYAALQALIKAPALEGREGDLLRSLPAELFRLADLPGWVEDWRDQAAWVELQRLVNEAHEHMDHGRLEEALDLLRASMELDPTPRTPDARARRLLAAGLLGLIHLHRGEADAALLLLDETHALAESTEPLGNRSGLGVALVSRGAVLEVLGRYDEALSATVKAAGVFEQVGEPFRQLLLTRVRPRQARLLRRLGRHPEAIRVLQGIVRDLDASPAEDQEREILGDVLRKLSDSLVECGRHAEAIDVIEAALGVEQSGTGDAPVRRADTLAEKALVLARASRLPDALLVLAELLVALEQTGEARDWKLVTAAHMMRGVIEGLLRGPAAAYHEYERALAASERLSAEQRATAPLHILAIAYVECLVELGRPQEALAALARGADALARSPEARDRATNVVIALAARGHARDALAALEPSGVAPLLEPLLVGLRLLLGEPYNAPREVVEVARDVAARVEALRTGSARSP
ncbi:MAG: AAA family ATPase [Planctomycetota bacterium]|nr:AAA family ATPase [Planctomycetota bacterium]